MTRKLNALQTLVIQLSPSSSHTRCAFVATLEGQIPPAGHVGIPGLTLRELLLILTEATDHLQQDNQTYREPDIDLAPLAYSDIDNQMRRDPVQIRHLILLNRDYSAPVSTVIILGTRAAQRQWANRKTLPGAWKGLAPAEGGSRALRWQEVGQDWDRKTRNAPLLEFLQPEPAFSVVYTVRNESQEEYRVNDPSPFAPCLLEGQRPLTGPDSALPAGPQPSALPGTPSAPASESPLPWQASAPPDEAESRQPSGGRRPRLRRHSAQPAAHYEHRSEGYAASGQGPAASPPAASEPTGTDVRAMRTYSALIQQTREEDRAELETLGGQIQAARAALGISRKQLVTLLHLDLELLVALEHGCGDVATARLVLEQVSAIVAKRRRAAAVQ